MRVMAVPGGRGDCRQTIMPSLVRAARSFPANRLADFRTGRPIHPLVLTMNRQHGSFVLKIARKYWPGAVEERRKSDQIIDTVR